MVKTTTPWLARQSLIGLLLGAAGAWVILLLTPAPPAIRVLLAAALLGVAYVLGFALAARARLADATRYILRLREELRGSQDHIMENGSFRSLGTYLDVSAGPLKTALAALQADARALAADPASSEATRPIAERLAAGAASIATTLGPLSGFALPETARAPFNVNNLLREALDLCRHRAEEKRIVFEERYAVIPPVFGPAGRVQGALLNIVVNAIEAMPFSGGRIVLESSHSGGEVIACVRDDGIGIRPEHLDRVFNPFFTTKPEKNNAGLGLWETRETLERIGATVVVRSAPHQGTEVVVRFPEAAPMSPGRAGGSGLEELPRNTADEGDRRIA